MNILLRNLLFCLLLICFVTSSRGLESKDSAVILFKPQEQFSTSTSEASAAFYPVDLLPAPLNFSSGGLWIGMTYQFLPITTWQGAIPFAANERVTTDGQRATF